MTLGPLAPVSRDCETMRFIAHALNQMQYARIRSQYSGRVLAQQEQLFLPRSPIGALRNADQGNSGNAQFLDHLGRFGKLSLAAVDEQYVRSGDFAVADPFITPGERLVHGGVVVARLDAADIEAPVIVLERPFLAEYHAGRHRVRAAGVADVEALDTVRRLIQVEGLAQILQAGFDAGARQTAHGQRLLGIVVHHLQPTGPNSTHG